MTGKATYAAEFTVPSVVHAVLVESNVGAGQIISFDLTEAQAHAGRDPDHHAAKCDPPA